MVARRDVWEGSELDVRGKSFKRIPCRALYLSGMLCVFKWWRDQYGRDKI